MLGRWLCPQPEEWMLVGGGSDVMNTLSFSAAFLSEEE